MRMRSLLRLVAATGVLAGSLLFLAGASATPTATTIRVTATDRTFALSTRTAPVGQVTFVVRNAGTKRHDFRVAGKKTRVLKPRQSARLVVEFAKAGRYAYRSTVTGDAKKGLEGVFRVNAVIPAYPPITILAAASLTDVLPAIDGNERYSFAGSNALATQIRNGVPADVYLSANAEIPARLFEEGLVQKPVSFTRNALVIVVPKANPAGISSVYDLTRPGVKLDVAASAVPVGSYTLEILRRMGLSAKVLGNVVSEETDVRNVLAKVALGQADAGFVYATDARTVPDDVRVIKVPAWAQPKVAYSMAVVSRSRHKPAARAYLARVLGPGAQATLARFGFLPRAPVGGGSYADRASL